MIVKVCGITNAADARLAAEAGATAIGFNFYAASPRFITVETARGLAAHVPATVLKVGVFVNEAPATVARMVAEAGLDIAQIIGDTAAGVRTWKVHRVEPDFAGNLLNEPNAEAFLLDTPSSTGYGGTGQTFDWSKANIPGKRIVIAGGLGPDNVAHAIRIARPWGVDACSRLESSPGRKDPGKVRAFVAAALGL